MTYNKKHNKPEEYFTLRQMKAAKVSEISETTAASSTPASERVNFHIGNPIIDESLAFLYFKTIIETDDLTPSTTEEALRENLKRKDYTDETINNYIFLKRTVDKVSPYTPRGGFARKEPGALMTAVKEWFGEGQQDALEYDLGDKSGNREITIVNGGLPEFYRILFHTLCKFLESVPAHVLFHNVDVPDSLIRYENLRFDDGSGGDDQLSGKVDEYFQSTDAPLFIVLGRNPGEELRRNLRKQALSKPLFFIEVHNSPNHLSMARESGMSQRVLRAISPEAFHKAYRNLAILFVAGDAQYIKAIETVHFQLKGTPAYPENELLNYILRKKHLSISDADLESKSKSDYDEEPDFLKSYSEIVERVTEIGNRFIEHSERNNESLGLKVSNGLESLFEKTRISSPIFEKAFQPDSELDALSAKEVIDLFFEEFSNPEYQQLLVNSFLSAFGTTHEMYDVSSLACVSGSARTALSILGFHCGIREVVSPDLSWTYEHCFPKTDVVPLDSSFELDTGKIIRRVEEHIRKDSDWKKRGAVILNNPHNASGRVFSEEKLKKVMTYLLGNRIFVIDDLSYQNVAPMDSLQGPKTLKEIALDLVETGKITSEQLRYLITVHSLSKTDCFAGGRLAVTEILHSELYETFTSISGRINHNITSILLAYLFYRRPKEYQHTFWHNRNRLFYERITAILSAVEDLPSSRNDHHIEIKSPTGSMYPQMIINRLPDGISLDWLSSGLAIQGIGLVPLSTFARTEEGFELARKTFRLTLGGADDAETLRRKTRRVLIDINRLIHSESEKYNKKSLPAQTVLPGFLNFFTQSEQRWLEYLDRVKETYRQQLALKKKGIYTKVLNGGGADESFDALEERLALFTSQFHERKELFLRVLSASSGAKKSKITTLLEQEFYKEHLTDRYQRFRSRLFDRTVHPTQVYSIRTEQMMHQAFEQVLMEKDITQQDVNVTADALIKEYLGKNVAIMSPDEGDELLLDLSTMMLAEDYGRWFSENAQTAFLSFWGDWDGSTRPSGQGHYLVAAALMENVSQMATLIKLLVESDKSISVDPKLLREVHALPLGREKFWNVFRKITTLTNQLEKRYRTMLPYDIKPGVFRKAGMKLGLAKDPLSVIWQHNDRQERMMFNLRKERKMNLEKYFDLNKRLRKYLYEAIPSLVNNLNEPEISYKATTFRSFLRRFVLTPRIHEKMITDNDQFAIDTTIHNIVEINEIAGRYGNPGMVLGLQISMSSSPDALIALDRKIRAHREEILRNENGRDTASIWCIPLFEQLETVSDIPVYLDKVWEYAQRNRRIEQSASDRFKDTICELFIAGSDLSQQLGQTSSALLYKQAKMDILKWLAEKGLANDVRMKLGSGEPMQRQGGYYFEHSGKKAFRTSIETQKRLKEHVKAATRRSTLYATTPLQGIMSSGDLRTFQSNVSEKLRQLPIKEYADILYHLKTAQSFHNQEIRVACEPIMDTRLQLGSRKYQELERISFGRKDPLFEEFAELVTKNFRHILFGREEDVFGIHLISYFIGRATPALRDRPTVRPGDVNSAEQGQAIIEKIAGIIPLSKHGSLMRAIGHNRSQSMILGVNQLTTGLFRALEEFITKYPDSSTIISERILPHLPVYEILMTYRYYIEPDLKYVHELEYLFPAGNTAFLALKEDIESFEHIRPLLQRELLRRQGLEVSEFFNNGIFNPKLLPTLRPDLAILLQEDILNDSYEEFIKEIGHMYDQDWLAEIRKLIVLPLKIKSMRAEIWNILRVPIQNQVESFVKLATALHTLAKNELLNPNDFPAQPTTGIKLGMEITDLLRGSVDDAMHRFFNAAVQYLTHLPQTQGKIPIDVIRVLKDVEQIVRIEGQAITREDQEILRYYILRIARLCGDNG